MSEIYEKRGASVRIERSGRATSTVVSSEHGRAIRERSRFSAESLGERRLPLAPDVAGAAEVARRLTSLEGGRVAIERMTVAAGVAEHAVSTGDSSFTWTEEVARVHVSFVNRDRAMRASVDLGAECVPKLPIDVAIEIASSLEAAGTPRASFDGLVELSPFVSASLWVFVSHHHSLLDGSRLDVAQSMHPAWPYDGSGRRVERHAVTDAAPPALFRPSFRAAPAPAWLHLRASLRVAGRLRKRAGARAVALLSPFRIARSGVSAGVLVVSGSESFAMTLEIPRERFAHSIVRISSRGTWFPLEAGAWGSNTLLSGAILTP
jgi:hypothetical protein